MQANSPSIAWLIPCFNEEVAIGRVIQDIRQHCPEGRIYVCDNASTDRTASVAREHGAQVIFEGRKGKGHAMRTLIESVHADFYFMIDGDATYDISQWRRLLEPVKQHPMAMAVGTRLQKFDDDSFRPLHFFGNRVISGSLNFFFKGTMSDVLSGYRCFGRNFVKGVALVARGFEIESELTIQALEHRFTIVEVPLPYFKRPPGSFSKLKTFHDGFIILNTILKLVKDHKPLTFFGVMTLLAGAVAAFAALRYGLSALALFSGTVAAMSLFSGIVLNTISQRSKEIMQVIRKMKDQSVSG